MPELLAIARALGEDPSPGAVLATLVSVQGSSYRRVGARLLLRPGRPNVGSISGGCLEGDLAAHAERVRATGQPTLVTYDTTTENDLVWGVGLGCAGVVKVWLQPAAEPAVIDFLQFARAQLEARRPVWALHRCDDSAAVLRGPLAAQAGDARWTAAGLADAIARDAWGKLHQPAGGASTGEGWFFREELHPSLRLLVFGAGDDAQPLVAHATALGWTVVVADPRPAFATAERFPGATAVHVARPGEVAGLLVPDPWTAAVIMTHHYVHDRPALAALASTALPYLGLLGPRKRAERLLADLAAEGWTAPADLGKRLHAPVGLDLGAEGPAEIAVAVVAEILARFNRRPAASLRERREPIHA